MIDIIDLLWLMKKNGASDLHLVVGSSPMVRVNGSLVPVDNMEPLTPEEISETFVRLTTPEQREKFHSTLELDFGYTFPGVGRFRCNAAQQRGAISFALRFLPPVIASIDELELPDICKELALRPRGLVIVTGPRL